MPSPTSYPWVNFLSTPTVAISSTPQSIFGTNYLGSNHACIIDSIFICNTSNQDIFIDIYTLTERLINNVLTAQTTYRFNKVLIVKKMTKELIGGAGFNMEQGDLLFAKSDFSGNRFDSAVSYRELREQ